MRLIALTFLTAAAAFLVSGATKPTDSEAIRATITAQMEAFRLGNDAAAFAIAAPDIQARFGDAEAFSAMVERAYPQVYRPHSITFLDLIEAHGLVSGRGAPEATGPLITALRLETAVALEKMRAFYVDSLGFGLVSNEQEALTVRAGGTMITFAPASREGTEPFYHFAFNIPHNALRAARRWQLERTPLVEWPADKSDPAYPNDVRHFRSWNAHSVFFWDPAGNIVEYIARHDLKNPSADPERFSSEDILYASEIAFVVDDQSAAARLLHNELGLSVYPKGERFWWAMGDERGLLLCIPKREWGTDPARRVRFGVFPTHATIRLPEAMKYALPGAPYTVEAAPA